MNENQFDYYILDFTQNELICCQVNKKKIDTILRTPYSLELSPEMCDFICLNIPTLNLEKNTDNRPILLSSLHSIMPLIAFHESLMIQLWKFFFQSNSIKKWIAIHKKIIIIVPLKWEPHISTVLFQTFTDLFPSNQICVVTDYLCVWHLATEQLNIQKELDDLLLCKIQNETDQYIYRVQKKDNFIVVCPANEYSETNQINSLSFDLALEKKSVSAAVIGWHKMNYSKVNKNQIVFDLQYSIGLLIDNNEITLLCKPDIQYGQYMNQSISLQLFKNTSFQFFAALNCSSIPLFFLARLEMIYEPYTPLDVHLCRLNASWGHVFINQTLSSNNKKTISDQRFPLPRLTR